MSVFTQQQMAELRVQMSAFRNEPKKRVPDELVDIDYKVLQDAVGSLQLPPQEPAVEDLRRRTVDDKLDFNHLTEESRKIINSSLVYSDEVGKFMRERAANFDPTFPDRLTKYFKGVYEEYHCNGLQGDDLFDALVLDVQRRIPRRRAHKGAFAILSHLFELCEVFEK